MNPSCRSLLAIVAIFPLFTGCEEEEVAWLPDSTGVVYRDADQGFSRFDLQAKKSTQMLKDAAKGQGLAISPKGDQFALSKVTRELETRTLEIAIYGFDGQEVQRSKPIVVEKAIPTSTSNSSGLEWTTSGQLVVYQDQELLGFFDVEAQTFHRVAGYNRYMERWVGLSAAADGTGVLAAKPAGVDEDFPKVAYFIDWQGKPRSINIPAPPAAVTAELNKEDHCLAYYGTWDKYILRHQVLDFRLDIDTRAGTAKWYSLPNQIATKIPARNPEFGYIAQPFGAGWYAYIGMGEKKSILGLVNPQTSVNKVLYKDIEIFGALRSPDGNKMAITITEKVKDKNVAKVKLLILDEKGDLVATIERGEVKVPPPPTAPPPP